MICSLRDGVRCFNGPSTEVCYSLSLNSQSHNSPTLIVTVAQNTRVSLTQTPRVTVAQTVQCLIPFFFLRNLLWWCPPKNRCPVRRNKYNGCLPFSCAEAWKALGRPDPFFSTVDFYWLLLASGLLWTLSLIFWDRCDPALCLQALWLSNYESSYLFHLTLSEKL